ncbi:histidinol-phosphate transaminase [Myroides sp. LJL119]
MKNKISISHLVRPHILDLVPYQSAKDQAKQTDLVASVFLDANENPYGRFNRYPDPYQNKLKNRLSQIKRVPKENIFLSNGSDELIDLTYRIFCEPKKDKAVVFTPSYGMYKVYGDIHQTKVIPIALDKDFNLPNNALNTIKDIGQVKVVFICSPNNPTGNLIGNKQIQAIVTGFDGIVILDQAYIDFVEQDSWLENLKSYPNLIVIQTLSKAWGAADLRIGMAFASSEILGFFNKVKSPYNISGIAQDKALEILQDYQGYQKNRQKLISQRDFLSKQLKNLWCVDRVFDSNANFLLVVFKQGKQVYDYLFEKGIVIRDRQNDLYNALRISVGTSKENKELINELKKFQDETKSIIYR